MLSAYSFRGNCRRKHFLVRYTNTTRGAIYISICELAKHWNTVYFSYVPFIYLAIVVLTENRNVYENVHRVGTSVQGLMMNESSRQRDILKLI